MGRRTWMPTLGGWLTILNCTLWLPFIVLAAFLPERWTLIGLVVLGSPFAWFCWLPKLHGPSAGDVLAMGVGTGLNSIVWGYGLAAIVRLFQLILRIQKNARQASSSVKPTKQFSN